VKRSSDWPASAAREVVRDWPFAAAWMTAWFPPVSDKLPILKVRRLQRGAPSDRRPD
jgi:hypothetical protein